MHRDYLPVAYAPGTVGPIRENLFRLVLYDKWAESALEEFVDEPLKSLGSDSCIFETIMHPVRVSYLFFCAFWFFAKGSLRVTVRLKTSFSFVVSGSTQK